MEIFFDDRVWAKEVVGFREEVGWDGGLSIGDVGNGHASQKECFMLVLARL